MKSSLRCTFSTSAPGPTPHGVGGLKYQILYRTRLHHRSHPSRGGWIEISKCCRCGRRAPSHPSRGGWIEIFEMQRCGVDIVVSPTPHGVGGLKCLLLLLAYTHLRPTPHGVGGLKFFVGHRVSCSLRPTPHGVGGLKSENSSFEDKAAAGPTPHGVGGLKYKLASPGWLVGAGPTPHGVGGLKCPPNLRGRVRPGSHPSRGGWIEIPSPARPPGGGSVPPLTGWVD